MDFSSNGKFLATCAEDSEELDPGGGGGSSEQCSGSEGNKENSPQENGKGILSRRQKKNRVRRDDGSPVANQTGSSTASMKKSKARARRSANSGDWNGSRRRIANAPALRQHAKLNLADCDLSVFLRHYILSPDQLLGLGYPVESSLYPGRAIIYKNPATNKSSNQSVLTNTHPLTTSSHFDVNAQEFVPMSAKQPKGTPCYYTNGNIIRESQGVNSTMYISNLVDRGHAGLEYCPVGIEWNVEKGVKREDHENNNVVITALLDDSHTKISCEEGFCKGSERKSTDSFEHVDCSEKDTSVILQKDVDEKEEQKQDSKSSLKSKVHEQELSGSDEKKCVRCGRGFFVMTDGEYLTQEQCLYHWGKLQKVVGPGPNKMGVTTVRTEYSCCRGKPSTRGCTTGKLHVWNGVGPGINGPFDGYVRTRLRKTPPPDGNFGVYALDCEMCFTTRGLELTKVTVVAADGRLVYDCLVRPENFIIDYNTRFSGITARDLSKRATKSLRDVQNDLMGFINADTILVGHGLENDLRALRIIHGTVIDTSVIFPHYYGLPYRRSLKSLVGCFLKRKIQQDSSGHDSFEDARACIELMLWRIRRDFRMILENRAPHFAVRC
ncbi:uncharacterized protein LOC110833298 isoform X3 [Zootermopsis nevadensis]|nr:uncharacterized protein LOC110833298 isoform X3 [Zootermopsis nevadensis]XP_021926875.1 uncharacterized protein LOC110833298 isoform X3 [Zootermopsis nevadensis]XP_021926876.1 uncharacterized protein LOC110833298 isoform X3 [Zootermopsis nevadensis]